MTASPLDAILRLGELDRALYGVRRRRARSIARRRSETWTGSRMVRPLLAIDRCTAWRIHHVA